MGLSENFLRAAVNETKFWSDYLINEPGLSTLYAFQPFLPSAFAQASEESSAFPFSRRLMLPSCITYSWTESSSDDRIHEAVRQSTKQLAMFAQGEGQDISHLPLYGNYAIFGTPLERIYGGNVERLKRIKQQYDPDNVMGLTGGWRL